MKIITKTQYDNYECMDSRFQLRVEDENGKRIGGFYISNLCECPEDATLNRDLDFVYGIPKLMQLAYEAGKRGEELTIEEAPYEED